MARRMFCLFLLVTLISSGFSRFFVYAGFELNHKFIADNLCINKSRPWMHCNGRCYFMRKIKEAQDNEKKQERAFEKNACQEGLPASSAASVPVFKEQVDLKIAYPIVIPGATIQRSASILQPPKVV